MRHFLELDDLSPAEVALVVDLASQVEAPEILKGQGVALLFQKPSGRTRNSMERAVVQLGGHPTTIAPDEVGIDTRESAEDVARTMSCFHSAVAARVFEHSVLERMARVSTVPIINLLSDSGHPIQALADLCTIRDAFTDFAGVEVAYIGDANNVAFSLGLACAATGMAFRVSHPDGYGFSADQFAHLTRAGLSDFIAPTPQDAARGATVVYTDAWYSMGQEAEAEERRPIFQGWRVDEQLMTLTDNESIFMHCLPAHRGDEVTDAVLDGPRSRVWPQAENRMHSARGLMWFLLDMAADT